MSEFLFRRYNYNFPDLGSLPKFHATGLATGTANRGFSEFQLPSWHAMHLVEACTAQPEGWGVGAGGPERLVGFRVTRPAPPRPEPRDLHPLNLTSSVDNSCRNRAVNSAVVRGCAMLPWRRHTTAWIRACIPHPTLVGHCALIQGLTATKYHPIPQRSTHAAPPKCELRFPYPPPPWPHPKGAAEASAPARVRSKVFASAPLREWRLH